MSSLLLPLPVQRACFKTLTAFVRHEGAGRETLETWSGFVRDTLAWCFCGLLVGWLVMAGPEHEEREGEKKRHTHSTSPQNCRGHQCGQENRFNDPYRGIVNMRVSPDPETIHMNPLPPECNPPFFEVYTYIYRYIYIYVYIYIYIRMMQDWPNPEHWHKVLPLPTLS